MKGGNGEAARGHAPAAHFWTTKRTQKWGANTQYSRSAGWPRNEKPLVFLVGQGEGIASDRVFLEQKIEFALNQTVPKFKPPAT